MNRNSLKVLPLSVDNLIEFFQFSGGQKTYEFLLPWRSSHRTREHGNKDVAGCSAGFDSCHGIAWKSGRRACRQDEGGAGLPGDCKANEDQWSGKDGGHCGCRWIGEGCEDSERKPYAGRGGRGCSAALEVRDWLWKLNCEFGGQLRIRPVGSPLHTKGRRERTCPQFPFCAIPCSGGRRTLKLQEARISAPLSLETSY